VSVYRQLWTPWEVSVSRWLCQPPTGLWLQAFKGVSHRRQNASGLTVVGHVSDRERFDSKSDDGWGLACKREEMFVGHMSRGNIRIPFVEIGQNRQNASPRLSSDLLGARFVVPGITSSEYKLILWSSTESGVAL